MTKVTVYSKPDCPLCDEAKEVLERVRAEVAFDLEEVDIESDPRLFERFRYDIPVIFVDGQKAFKHRLEANAVKRRLLK